MVHRVNNWFEAPPVKSTVWAIFWVAVAVAAPAILRTALADVVSASTMIFFVPSVLLSAILLGWRAAAAVALASALIVDLLFIGNANLLFEGAADFMATAAFLIASGLIIAAIELPRQVRKERVTAVADKDPAGIVFSLEQGQAWASWYGRNSSVRLGPESEVAEMMEDFLAQLEVGKRLTSGHN